MGNNKISDVGINIAEKATVIWNVADMLRGPFKPHEYGLVILPMTVVKRFQDCLLPTYDNVLAKYKIENEQLKLQSHFNAAVHDAIAIAVSDKIEENPNFYVTEDMKNKIENLFYDKDFIDCINGSTNDKSKILNRIKIVKGVLQ
ncbi:MAG: hypothetical protein HFJ01_13800 [Lachnospiraceae bacterium]|jgi:type I restriction enzyme M protein|nr:hypothetical protein [Lachnospiraceae bacterium]